MTNNCDILRELERLIVPHNFPEKGVVKVAHQVDSSRRSRKQTFNLAIETTRKNHLKYPDDLDASKLKLRG